MGSPPSRTYRVSRLVPAPLRHIIESGENRLSVSVAFARPAGAYRQAARERIGCAFASWCINRHVDGGLELPLKLVQTRLGHASIQMTANRYGHLFPRGDDGAELAAAETAYLS
jgi:integrase